MAVAGNFVTKYAMLVFPKPLTILTLQLLTTVLLLKLAHASGLLTIPRLSLSKCKQHLPLALIYAAHAYTVLKSLATLSVPMYNTLKRLTPVMVLVAQVCACLPACRHGCTWCMYCPGL